MLGLQAESDAFLQLCTEIYWILPQATKTAFLQLFILYMGYNCKNDK